MTLPSTIQSTDAAEQPAVHPADARKHSRHDVETAIDFSSETNFFHGLSENLSEGGIFIATYEHSPIGTHLRLRFALPDEEAPIEAEAEVRWLRVYNPDTPDTMPGMGLRFTTISDHDVARIGEFIQTREPLFHEE